MLWLECCVHIWHRSCYWSSQFRFQGFQIAGDSGDFFCGKEEMVSSCRGHIGHWSSWIRYSGPRGGGPIRRSDTQKGANNC